MPLIRTGVDYIGRRNISCAIQSFEATNTVDAFELHYSPTDFQLYIAKRGLNIDCLYHAARH